MEFMEKGEARASHRKIKLAAAKSTWLELTRRHRRTEVAMPMPQGRRRKIKVGCLY